MTKLDQLHPVLRRKVKAIISDLAGHGYPAKVASGWRTRADQLALYRAGRSKVKFSFHNATYPGGAPCALAADVVHRDVGWNASEKFWELLASSRKAHNLHETASWDKAHIQLLPNSYLKKVRAGWIPPEHWNG